jgi:nitrogen fixation protein FixH
MKRFVTLTFLMGLLLVSCPNTGPSCGFDACRLELRLSVNGLTLQSTSNATVGVTVSAPNGYTGSVDLTTRNLPSGVTAKFVPDRISLGGIPNGMSILTLTSAGGAATSQPIDLMVVAVGQGAGVQQALKLTITPDGPPNTNPTLSLSPKAVSLTAGGAVQVFSTKLVGTGTINWSLSNPGLGTLSSPTGPTVTYTPPPSMSADASVVLTATIAGTGISDAATITLSPAPPSGTDPRLTVSPKALSVNAGGAGQTFSTTLQNASGAINWSLNPNLGTLSSPTGGTVTYTPPATLAQNTPVTLTATVSGMSLSDVATITVIAPPPPPPTISVSPRSVSVTAGAGAQSFAATVQNSASAVNWSLNPNVGTLSSATGSSVSYTPPATVAQNTNVTLTATIAGTSVTDAVTVIVAPIPPPSAPGSFTATATSSSTVDLSWVAASGMTAYTLERASGSTSFIYAQIATPSASATTYADSGLTGGLLYKYRLTATNSGGTSPSLEIAVITPSPAATTIAISPTPGPSLYAGEPARTFTATLNGAGTVTWGLSVATGTLSSTTGTSVNYSPPTTSRTTDRKVNLTAIVDGTSVTDSVTITIYGEPIDPPPPPCSRPPCPIPRLK